MSAGPDPRTANAQLIEQERRRLSQRLDEVARLCESGAPPSVFYGEMLQRLIESLAAVAGCVWLRTPQGNLQQQFQINMQQVGIDTAEESRQSHDTLLRGAFANGQPLHLPPRSFAGPAEDGRPAPGNPTACILLLAPIRQNEQVIGLVEVFQGPNRPSSAVPGFLQYMSLMADLAARYQRNQLVGQLVGQQQLWTQLEGFARAIHASLNPTEVAFQIANEGRRLIECDRVSVAIRRNGEKGRIEAVSGSDVVEHRSNLVRRLRILCDEVLTWGERLVFSGTKDDTLPPKVLDALDAYLAESHSKLLIIMPLRDERDGDGKDKPKQPPRSALVMEHFESPPDQQQTIARLDVVARHATSALYNAVEHRRIPMRFLWMPLARLQEGLGGKTRAIVLAVVVALSAVIAALYALPYPLKMDATGQVLPVVRRTVYSPAPGTIERFEVQPNEVVPENSVLARMYDANLFQKYNTLMAELTAAEKEVIDLEARVERESGVSQKLDVRTKLASRRVDQESKRREIDELVRRDNAQRDQPGWFNLLAPVMTAEERRQVRDPRWTVLTSNFKWDLEKREVKPNDPVMRLGAKQGPWELELKIPQKHIGQVRKAFNRLGRDKPLDIDFLLLSETTVMYKGKLYLDRVAGEATPKTDDAQDNEPHVLAYVRIDGDDIDDGYKIDTSRLTSGTEVRAKVRCGNARAGYALFYGVWEFLYEKVVFFLF
ncbi:MAG: hypothetical protein U0736_21705 [Gemmataceae bacterium]